MGKDGTDWDTSFLPTAPPDEQGDSLAIGLQSIVVQLEYSERKEQSSRGVEPSQLWFEGYGKEEMKHRTGDDTLTFVWI